MSNLIGESVDLRPYVYGIRLFLDNDYMPMAELALGEGGKPNGQTVIIPWYIPAEREKYVINAFTFIWDERTLPADVPFEKYVKGEY